MKFLAIDGNSILNRAFYGIKLLTTKDGQYTNGIYGFLNILIKLEQEIKPDHVAVALTLKQKPSVTKCLMVIKPAEKVCLTSLHSRCPCLRKSLPTLAIQL